jgi:N-acyl-D-aspartate/D-glutamate deacylase
MRIGVAHSCPISIVVFLFFSNTLYATGDLNPTDPRENIYNIIIRGGKIYDGSGSPPRTGDVAITGDTIMALGSLPHTKAKIEIDAAGLAVAPGFINMLSWAGVSLIEDGHAQSDIRQGVTLEVMGEGMSMGPLNRAMKQEKQRELDRPVPWTTLGEYLEFLVQRRVSTNVASFVGNATIRQYIMGNENRTPTPNELDKMRRLVRQAMEEGALGVSSALIYVPSMYADTEELIALAKVVAKYDGMYISHIRNEGSRLLEAAEELITIARKANIRAEIYHLKAAGNANHHKLDKVIKKIETARAAGLHITANMYPYTAAATGLNVTMPPWVHEGGQQARARRLQNPQTRKRIRREMLSPSDRWENIYLAVESPDNILLAGFQSPNLRILTGKTLAQVAALRGTSPEETVMDLILEDNSRVDALFFYLSEENVRKKIALPWMSFGSDEIALAPQGHFLDKHAHPRAYGTFARILGLYVREEKIIPLETAIQRMTSLPAENLRLKRRGALKPGYFADVVVFNPATIKDHATYERPHQYATGVMHVFVNGVPVLRNGKHTGAKPGRVVRGPGWQHSPTKQSSKPQRGVIE